MAKTMSSEDAAQAVQNFVNIASDVVFDLTNRPGVADSNKENIRRKIMPALDLVNQATQTLRVSAVLNTEQPSPFLSVVQKATTATGSRIDQLGISGDCYLILQGIDITKGLRDVSRGRNPIFSKVIHLVRDVLLVSPAASSAFISFLDKCEAVSKDQPSFETCPLRLTNRFHGLR